MLMSDIWIQDQCRAELSATDKLKMARLLAHLSDVLIDHMFQDVIK